MTELGVTQRDWLLNLASFTSLTASQNHCVLLLHVIVCQLFVLIKVHSLVCGINFSHFIHWAGNPRSEGPDFLCAIPPQSCDFQLIQLGGSLGAQSQNSTIIFKVSKSVVTQC